MSVKLSLERDPDNVRRDVARARWVLISLLLFNGVGAVFGGIGVLTESLGLSRSLLEGTPFTDYTIPGWFLVLAVGGTSLGAAIALLMRFRHASFAAILAGVVLLGWIVAEFVMIPEGWIIQFVFFVVSLAILWLGLVLRR